MEVKEFVEETANIENYYGKELEKYQRDIWFQELKNMNVNRYRQIIRQVYRKCKFMPKLADILEIQEQLPYQAEKIAKREKAGCKKCKGLGLIFYKKLIDNGDRKLEYEYVARCNCANGLEYIYDGTKVSDIRHRSNYYIPTMEEIGI